MKKREVRRDRTIRYGERARRVYLRTLHPSDLLCVYERSVGYFAKGKSVGCRCRRRGRNCSPKVVNSMCHGGGGGYHPSVVQRIEGRRATKAWLKAVRNFEPDDIEL